MDSVTLITGTKEDNVLAGTIGTDVLLGKGGDDLLNGGAGNDLLVGGKGDDELNGGAGNDLLLGGNGDDQLDGGAGNDLLDGGNGDDTLDGGAGNDLLDGGNGDDLLDGGAGSDIVLAGKGDDTANYIVSANFGARDLYDGGNGYDTLQLMLTSAELKIAQADITAFQAFLEGSGKTFHFHSFDLTVRNFEALEIHLVDGNVSPVASGNTYEAVEDVALVISGAGVLGNDSDAEGAALKATLVTGPANGTVTLNGDGSFTYTPHANFFGEDSFTYKANDGALDSNVATVTLQVAAVNDKPVATDDTFRTDEDVPLNGNVLGNDVDVDNDALSAMLVAGPKNGTLVFTEDGSFSYTPDADYFGDDFFTYRAKDGAVESDLTTVKLSVNPVNDAPVAVDDDIAGTAGGASAIRVAVVGGSSSNYQGVATQLDGSSTDFKFAAESILVTAFATKAEWLTMLANYDVVVVGENGLSVSDYEGTQLFAALRDFVDAGGGVVTTGWFAGEIAAYSDAAIRADADYISPAASSPDSLYTGASSSISVLDASHPIAGGIDGYAVQGYVHELAGAVDASATVLASGGASALAAIAYDEVGTHGGLTVYLGSLHMANAAFASDATRDGAVDQILEQAVAWAAGEQVKGTASTDEDTPLLIDDALLLGNDSDVEGNALTIASVAAKSKLGAAVSINADGDIVYDPTSALQGLAAGELARDSFWYEISDGKGGMDTATVNVTVAGLADHALGDSGDAGLSLGLGTPDADVLL